MFDDDKIPPGGLIIIDRYLKKVGWTDRHERYGDLTNYRLWRIIQLARQDGYLEATAGAIPPWMMPGENE